VEASYKTIATNLLAACPPGIDRAWLTATLNEGHTQAEYWYEKDGAETQPKVGSGESFQIARALHDIRDEMTRNGQPPWQSCTFSVEPGGRFKFDVAYADQAAG
jgi:hypothetical protein